MSSIENKAEEVRARVEAACGRVGRKPDDVCIVAVAKTYGPDDVAMVSGCGFDVIGENRVQEAKQKIPLCPGGLEWHMLGHLQSNKVKDAVQLFSMIHSVDSEKLLGMINGHCAEAGKIMRVCLEVNVSGEGSKFGFSPDEVPGVLESNEY